MIWIILSIVLYLYLGHCLYMLCDVVSEESNEKSIGVWFTAVFIWPLVLLIVGTIHTVGKVCN